MDKSSREIFRTQLHFFQAASRRPFPTIAGMVEVQRLAAMRPSEVCKMKAGDIDRSKDIWLYQPDSHKNGWREHVRIIPLGKPEQEIIAPRLDDKAPDAKATKANDFSGHC